MIKTQNPQAEINLDVIADIIASQIKRSILIKLQKKKNAKNTKQNSNPKLLLQKT